MADEGLQNTEPALFDAITRSDAVVVERAISARQEDIEARDCVGRTPLHLAIIAGSPAVCRCLLEHGARIDAWTEDGEAPVHLAAKRGDLDVLIVVMDAIERQPLDTKPPKEVVDVNCLTRKYKMSALYIAVALAHTEIVRALLSTYNANVNLFVGETDFQRGLRSMHVLEGALQHPKDTCRSILKLCIQHGASLLERQTRVLLKSLLYLVIQRHEEALDIFAEYDQDNFTYAITKTAWKESVQCDTPLTWAIRSRSEAAAFQLLSYGASPEVKFDSSLDAQVDFLLPGKTSLQIAEDFFFQPIILAAQSEMPKLMMELLNRGVDPHVELTSQQADKLFEHRDCRNSLDFVQVKLAELRDWDIEDESVNYDVRGTPEESKQLSGKQAAVAQLISEYEEAEVRLTALGVTPTNGVNIQPPPKNKPYRIDKAQSSTLSKGTGSQPLASNIELVHATKLKTPEEGHSALITACQLNDVSAVKALTLATWGIDNQFPPIAIADISGYSAGPFAEAVRARSYDVARMILHIATVQQADISDMEALSVSKLLADSEHQVEAILALHTQFKTTTNPKKIVLESYACVPAEKTKDMEMLKFAIDTETSFGLDRSDIQRHARHAWALVEGGDWPDAFEEYIKATGAPFTHAVVNGKMSGRTQLDKLHQASPLLHAARSGNAEMVRFFLDKSKVLTGYGHFAAKTQFDTRKGTIEHCRAQFLTAVEKWLDNKRNLLIHCAILSRNMDLVRSLASTHPELLEIPSIDGWTPLLVAACQGKVEALEILLKYGANPLATDPLGRNMVHLLLASPGIGGWPSDPEVMLPFFRSMDAETLQILLKAHCVESPGGQTPISRWILTRPEPGILFTGIIEQSNLSPFEMLDGSGYTPLHTVMNSSMERLVQPLVEKAPHTMFIEGTGGKTPFDIAIDRQLQEQLKGFMSTYLRIKRWPTPISVIHWPLFTFGTGYSGAMYLRDPYDAWEVSNEKIKSMALAQRTRRLITKVALDEVKLLSDNKKVQRQPKGNQHDEISLAVYKPGNLYW